MRTLSHIGVAAVLCVLVMPGMAVMADTAAELQTSPRGAQYRDLVDGGGVQAEAGDVVTVHVHARVADDGEPAADIYNTRAMGTPVSFVVGTDNVMPAWNDCVVGMRAGGRRLMIAPPALAYGAKGVQDLVPPEATIVLVIELVAVDKKNAAN